MSEFELTDEHIKVLRDYRGSPRILISDDPARLLRQQLTAEGFLHQFEFQGAAYAERTNLGRAACAAALNREASERARGESTEEFLAKVEQKVAELQTMLMNERHARTGANDSSV